MSRRLRLAVWTPLPPQPSGIADYNRRLLPILARNADVSVVVDDHVLPEIEPFGVEIVGRSEFIACGGPDRVELNVFHMGNHPAHALIHDAAIEYPGLLVLHDASLLDFYWVRCGGYGPEYDAEVRHQEGADAVGARDHLRMPMVRRLVEASRGVVVHSAWLRDRLQRGFPHRPVLHVPLAAPLPPNDAGGAELRRAVGWSHRDVVFAALGAMVTHKRLDLIVRIVSALHAVRPQTRLLVAGRSLYPEVRDHLFETRDRLGLDSVAHVLADADETTFDACLDAADVLVDLRWPTAGEIPATLMRGLSAGVPAVVTDLPQLRGLDERAVRRVPTEAGDCARSALAVMTELCDRPDVRTAASDLALEEAARASPDIVVDQLLAAAARVIDHPRPARRLEPHSSPAPRVTVVGDYTAGTGLAEAGRRLAAALADAKVPVTRFDFVNPHAAHYPDLAGEPLASLPQIRDADVEVWFLNFNELRLVDRDVLRPPGVDRHVIGSWFWEAPSVTDHVREQLARVDEVWVPSRYVRDTFRMSTDKPVTVVPPVVDVPSPGSSSRRDLGLPESSFLFFFSFDANSTAARKNPLGLITAFERAFDPSEREHVRLVIKISNLGFHDQMRRGLAPALERVNAILLDEELTRGEMNDLLASIDVYASLHRAEGFGLGLAESMFLGKPVIATAYSGNMDFTTRDNACLVGYRLAPITVDDHRLFPPAADMYVPGLPWAVPDVAQAARWMRLLLDRPALRRRLGAAGAATIRERFGPDVVASRACQRLDEIHAARQRRA